MGLPAFRETPEFKFGHEAEILIANHLQRRGWFIIPSYDYSGDDQNKAPKLQGLEMSYIVPDLDCCRNGERKWVEVKAKTAPTLTTMLNRLEHGIPLRHYEHYLAVQKETGCEVWLCIYEKNTRLAWIQKLDVLAEKARYYHGDKMSRGGMVFFARDAFVLLASFEPKPAEDGEE